MATGCDRRQAHAAAACLSRQRRGRPSELVAEDVRRVSEWCRKRFRHFGPWAIVKNYRRALFALECEERMLLARQLDTGQRVFA